MWLLLPPGAPPRRGAGRGGDAGRGATTVDSRGFAAWQTLRRVAAGELGPPVAACAACGQPMFAVEGDLPALPRWEVALPEGPIGVGPDGRAIDLDDAEADRRIGEHYRAALVEHATAAEAGFALVLLAMIAGIGAILGPCECSSIALASAVSAGAAASRQR